MEMMKSIAEKAIELRDKTVELLIDLVSADTTDYNEENGQIKVVNFLKKLDSKVDTVQPDPVKLEKYSQYNPGHTYENRYNVVGTISGLGGGKSLLLHAHMDTVFPASPKYWLTDPYTPQITNGKIFGLGSADTKGSMAAMLMAMKLVKELEIPLRGDIIFQSVVDEEAGGGNGSLACLDAGYRADGVIIGEPNHLVPMSAHVGSFAINVIVDGKSAHGNMKWKGTSAFEKAMPIINALKKLEDKWNLRKFNLLPSPIITILEIKSGDGSITIPGSCEMLINYTYLPDGYDYNGEIMETIKHSVSDDPWFAEHPLRIKKHHDCGPYYTNPKEPWPMLIAETASNLFGKRVEFKGMACGADARLYANIGRMPTVILGPGSIDNAHQPNEFVLIDELVDAVKLYASIIYKWAGSSKLDTV